MGEYWYLDLQRPFHTAKAGVDRATSVLTTVKNYVGWYNKVSGKYQIPRELMGYLDGVLSKLKSAKQIAGYIEDIEKIQRLLDAIYKASKNNQNGEQSQLLAALFGELIVAVSAYVVGFPGAATYASLIKGIGERFKSIYGVLDPWGAVNQFSPSEQRELRAIIANPNRG